MYRYVYIQGFLKSILHIVDKYILGNQNINIQFTKIMSNKYALSVLILENN